MKITLRWWSASVCKVYFKSRYSFVAVLSIYCCRKIVGGKVQLQMLDEEDVNEHEERIAKEGGFKIGLPQPVNRVKYVTITLRMLIALGAFQRSFP